jgi:ParB family transcriptional regulator, chromosome partitioning protein
MIPAISSSRQVPVSHLQEGPNPWRERNPKTDDLEESLARSPMLAPLVVRALPGKRGKWQVIAGHRRLKAARAKGWSHVEVRIVSADDKAAEILSLEENLRRRAVKNEPAALARLLALYKEVYPERTGRPGKSVQIGRRVTALQALARTSGKSVREARRLARIGRASKQVQALYSTGNINVLEAERLATLKPRDQQRQLKLLAMPKVNEHSRALEALRYALKNFRATKAHGRVRRHALALVSELRKALS